MRLMKETSSMQEAIRFFRGEPGFNRLLKLFKQKYESLGRVGGTVNLARFTAEERHAIAEFYGMHDEDLTEKPVVSLQGFERQLQKTRFEGVTLHELLEQYFGEPIVSNKARREQKEATIRAFFVRCGDRWPIIENWVAHILQNPVDARFIYSLAHEDRDRLDVMIGCVAEALAALPDPGQAERLPLFAQRVTGDPHAFDVQEEQGRLLLHALAVQRASEEREAVKMPAGSEAINDLLQYAGLLRDDLHNFVTCAGLLAETADGIHPAWRAMSLTQTVWHVPVRELVKTSTIYPSKGHHVWIVENSGVCSAILDACPEAPVVCTHGQFKLATWLLLDRLAQKDVILHYSGDYDPEGLGMAQTLKDRYPEHMQLWHMNVGSYRKTEPQKQLGEERLKKLNRITDPELLSVARAMQQRQAAGYQEALLDTLIADIKGAFGGNC